MKQKATNELQDRKKVFPSAPVPVKRSRSRRMQVVGGTKVRGAKSPASPASVPASEIPTPQPQENVTCSSSWINKAYSRQQSQKNKYKSQAQPNTFPRKTTLRNINMSSVSKPWDNSKGPKNAINNDDDEFCYNKKYFEELYKLHLKTSGNPETSPRPTTTNDNVCKGEEDNKNDSNNNNNNINNININYNNNMTFETVADKHRRLQNDRLRANRVALGIDGGRSNTLPLPPFQHDFSNEMLQKELERFAKRRNLEQQQGKADDDVINSYESKWKQFEASPSVVEIPFLPLNILDEWKIVGFRISKYSKIGEKKTALRKATMRWHPDAFFSKFSSCISPTEIDNVMENVNVCAQRLNELRRKLKIEQEDAAIDDLEKTEFSFTKRSPSSSNNN